MKLLIAMLALFDKVGGMAAVNALMDSYGLKSIRATARRSAKGLASRRFKLCANRSIAHDSRGT